MLINLSSELELDPSKFTNNFNEIIEIPPNSYICLVKGSIIREKNQKQVSIPPDTDLFIRYTCYDVARLRLNPGGTRNQILAIDAFVDDINSRFAAVGFAYTKQFKAVIRESDDGDQAMDLIFYHQALPADITFTLETELYGTTHARITRFGEIFQNNNLLPFPPGATAGNYLSSIKSNATEWGLSPIWDTTYRTPNTNQTNATSFGMLIDPHALPNLKNNGYAPMQWFVNQNNVYVNIAYGLSTSNTLSPTQVLTGPIQGTAQGDNPTGKDYIADITYESDSGFFTAAAYDIDTSTFETSAEIPYNPADYFEFFFRANETPPIEFDNCMYANLIHYKANGLVFLYNGNLGTIAQRPLNNNFFLRSNTTNPLADSTSLNNMSFPYTNEHLKNLYYKQDPGNLNGFADQFITDFQQTQSSSLNGNACLGIKGMNGFTDNDFATNVYEPLGAGWVYNQSNGRPSTAQFTSAYANDAGVLTQWRYSTGTQMFNNRDGVKRANNSIIEIPNVYRINNHGGIVCDCPTMIAFSATFDLAAETMYPDEYEPGLTLDPNLRTLCGNGLAGGKLFEIQLNQANTAMPAGWDFRLSDQTGNTYVNILVDANGQRINFRGSSNTVGYTYNFVIEYYGPSLNSFEIHVEETRIVAPGAGVNMVTTSFKSQGPIMPLDSDASRLATINCWGGINVLTDNPAMTNYNNYSPLTYLCNFRVYQLCTRIGTDDTIFDLQRNAMLSYFRSHPVYSAIDANDTFWIANTDENRPSLIDFYPNTTNQFILPTAAMGTNDNYNTTGISRPESNVNVIIQKLGTDTPSDPNSPVLNSLHIPPNQIINNSRRFTNLGQLDYAGYGEGLVNLTEADLILDFIAPEPDENDNIVQSPEFLNVGIQNPTSRIITEIDEAIVQPQAMNIEITNLTHRCLNGTNKSNDKTIYQLPMISNTEEIGNNEIVEFTPPSKVWLSLNNPGSIYLNKMDIQISNTDGTKVSTTVLKQDTLISIQIENDKNLLN
tara:strand:+ start:796 stop:3798 length:3003 start_codon:yes stop_codon:yes gene_type:complete